MLKIIRPVFYVIILLLLTTCGARKPFYSFQHRKWKDSQRPDSSHIIHSVYLVGDAGDPDSGEGEDPLLSMLKYHLDREERDTSKAKHAVIFLGDNIYEHGLPPSGTLFREENETDIKLQMNAVKEFVGKKIFVPGNHDWNKSEEGGYEAILRQQNFIEEYMDDEETFFPKDGCPGPAEVLLSEDMVMIFLDTEWYLTEHFRPLYPDCTVEGDEDFFFEFKRAVKRNEGKHILVAMHHPLYSNGNHGGHFSLKDNLFPLSLVNKYMLIPLPGIGSFYTLLRKYGISRQDIPNARYQSLKNGLEDAVKDVKNVTFVSGHDHNMQLTEVEDKNFIVSGSASKVNFSRRGLDAAYVQSVQGFSRLDYYDNGEVWVDFYAVNDDKVEGDLTFSTALYSLDPTKNEYVDDELEHIDYSDSVATVTAGKEYKASAWRELWLGKHYRDEWTEPVKVDYLQIHEVGGGLHPIKQGGGKQTISLRMMGKDGNQYNLRSINKNPAGAVPSPFRDTFAEDLVKDQISSAHPYGAFTIPPMAKAARLYRTRPELVYIPFAPVLGEYLNTFGGMTALLEIRPDEDLSEFSRFGRTTNAVSTNTMLEKLKEDNDNEVNAEMYLKSRFFDLIVNDWDRHEDQWRWSEFEKSGKGEIYLPIPRDRDQVYTKYDGIIPWVASRKWAVRNITHFDYDYPDVIGTALTGNGLDRQLLGELDKSDWQTIARELQQDLTDESIDEGMKLMPEEVQKFSADEIAAKLKSRRDKLYDAVMEWYDAFSRDVDVLGTDKHEKFELERFDDGRVDVKIYKTKKEGNVDKLIYQRMFYPSETRELRVYTFKGNDVVEVSGSSEDKIKIRVITSLETKAIKNSSGGRNMTVYKKEHYKELELDDTDINVKESNRDYIIAYDPSQYSYSYFGPKLSFQFNRDAGLFYGGGIVYRTHGFHKSPFAAQHTIMANYASTVQAYNFIYEAEFPDLLGFGWDILSYSRYHSPQFVTNYFGEGNGSDNDRDIDYYRIDIGGFDQKLFLQKSVGALKMGIGPTFNYYDVERQEGNITTSTEFDSPEDLQAGRFVGSQLYFDIDKRDRQQYPRNGLKWDNRVSYKNNLIGEDEFVNVTSNFAVYLTPNLPFYMTIATRFGVSGNFGNYPFYQSATLGGNTNLRGYRMQRFAGETALYQNTELRFAVSKVKNYVFTGYWGLFGFVDHGRIFSDDPTFPSKEWHRGYGPGIWANFFQVMMTSAGFGMSEEGNFFYLRGGFLF